MKAGSVYCPTVCLVSIWLFPLTYKNVNFTWFTQRYCEEILFSRWLEFYCLDSWDRTVYLGNPHVDLCLTHHLWDSQTTWHPDDFPELTKGLCHPGVASSLSFSFRCIFCLELSRESVLPFPSVGPGVCWQSSAWRWLSSLPWGLYWAHHLHVFWVKGDTMAHLTWNITLKLEDGSLWLVVSISDF